MDLSQFVLDLLPRLAGQRIEVQQREAGKEQNGGHGHPADKHTGLRVDRLRALCQVLIVAEDDQRINSIRSAEPPDLNPVGRSQFLTHQRQTDRAVVLFHGYTNCPQQFKLLGEQLHARGYNVWILRMAGHGHADRLTDAYGRIKAERMIAAAAAAIDIAQGLGREVRVMGLSMGGLMTTWVAHNRSDVVRAVSIAQASGFKALPKRWTPLIRRIVLILPNKMQWWDATVQDKGPGPQHAYPRYGTHGLAQLLRFGAALRAQAARSIPAARSVVIVKNDNDESVDMTTLDDQVNRWRSSDAQNVETYTFGVEQRLVHDMIDPDQPAQRVDYVYPILIDWLEQ
jgi:carboxylesterase